MPHFHLLLANDVPAAVFEERARYLLTTARIHGKPIGSLDAESIDVREVHDVHGAARYVTKVLEPYALRGEQMLVIADNRIFPDESY
jgi:hypothetical protein